MRFLQWTKVGFGGLALALLLPILLFIIRWGEWNFQPSWIAAGRFFSDVYVPLFTFVSITAVAYQIWAKASSDKAAFLMETFRRQLFELEAKCPGRAESLYYSVTKDLESGIKSSPVADDFYRNYSRFVHSVLAIGYSLTRLQDVDRQAAEMLRMELFTRIDQATFAQYEYVAYVCVRPSNYRWICYEKLRENPI